MLTGLEILNVGVLHNGGETSEVEDRKNKTFYIVYGNDIEAE